MRALKIAIAIMTTLLVVGLAVLVGELLRRAADPSAPAPDAPAGEVARTVLDVPAETKIVRMRPVDGGLAVRVRLPEGAREPRHRIYVVDVEAGRVVGTIAPAPLDGGGASR